MSENTGFFSKILERRIPQFLGIFLAGSWTALEFTSWAVERYSLSPNWEEVLVVCLLLCLPLILVLAWHHGAPGKQKWTLFEKFFIPIYLLFIPLALHHIYKDVELGKTIEMVMVEDESGKMQEREVAKQEYLKSILIYPLKNISGSPDLDYLAAGTSEVLKRDLQQNNFFSILDLETSINGLKNAGQTYKNIPLSFQINYAKERARKYLVNGSLNKVENQYQISLDLYSTNTGRKVTNFKASNTNYFYAIDELTIALNDHFFKGISEYTDLPIEDLYTSNWQAFESYTKARLVTFFGDTPQEAVPLFKEAIKTDPTFSMASFAYALYTVNQSKIIEAREYISKAQKNQDYRLTERERFTLNTIHYFLSQQREKAFAVLDQWNLLYPNDWQAYFFRAQFAGFGENNLKVATENFKKVIELDPSQHALWDVIGDMYNQAGMYDEALDAYEKYIQSNPNNPVAYKNLGDLYIKSGKFDSVLNNYQKALSIEPNNPNVLANLANAYARIGEFEKAETNYLLAIQKSNISNDISNKKIQIARFYWSYGKRKSAVKFLREAFVQFAETNSVERALQQEALFAWQYYLAGEQELALEVIDKALKILEGSNEDILLINTRIAQAMLLNLTNQPEKALSMYDEMLKVGGSYSAANANVINHYKGQSLFYAEQYPEAIEAFLPIHQTFPDRFQFMEWLAKAYFANDQLQEASKLYQRLLSLAPAYPNFNLGMAKVLIASGNTSEAKGYVEKALKAWGKAEMEFEELTEARKLLASI